ncbi:MAG: GGDEF domain-containing protein [Leptolinea sp.]|nr:GGDEF domain-containing protein [Leptolinea sp.]
MEIKKTSLPDAVTASRSSGGQSAALFMQVKITIDSRLRYLKFPADIEDIYEQETGAYRLRQLSLYALLGMVIYDFFLIIDQTIIEDVFQTALIIRLGVMTPLVLLLLGLFQRGVSPAFRETAMAVLNYLTGISLIFLMAFSNSENKIFYHPGLILVITYSNLVMRMHFWDALVSSALLFITYIFFFPSLPTLPVQVPMANIMILFGCNVLTLYSNYVLEREQKLSFLYSLLERIRQGQLATQNRKLSRLALLDPLTRLANRREIDEYVARLYEDPHPNMLAVIMLDIDHFKKYNDTYGHPAGDDCLKSVARVLKQIIRRRGDVVGRIGGEEFIVFMPEADMPAAIKKAEEIRAGVMQLSMPHASSPVANVVTISAGVSAGQIHFDTNPRQLLLDADEALYKAKSEGRNRVASA